MKIVIIAVFLLQLSTSLWADKDFKEYLNIKKIAYELHDSGAKAEAISYVKEFIDKNPKSIRAKNLLAVLYFWNRDYKEAKSIIHEILKVEQFQQSVKLLKEIQKKEINKESIEDSSKKLKPTKDLQYVVKMVNSNPLDIENRKILVYHFDEIGESKEAIYMAEEVLKIDPDDTQMLRFLKSKNPAYSKDRVESAIKKLNELYSQRSYNKFLNLYNSLEHSGVEMPVDIHINALYSAIELKMYRKAKAILYIYRFPNNRYIDEIEDLVDEKLLLQRFTSLN